jgi:hypothetical protein
MPPVTSSSGAVIDGELDAKTAEVELESTMTLPPTAVTDVVPERVSDEPEEFSAMIAAVEYGVNDPPSATALAVADIEPAPQIALKYLGPVDVIVTPTLPVCG